MKQIIIIYNLTLILKYISPSEYKQILEAVRNKRKYYKLKNNSFVNLEEKEINDFL